MRGYFGIGVEQIKCRHNVGTLFRSAYIFGAKFIFLIGLRYKYQCSDVLKAYRHIPLFQYNDVDTFLSSIPYDCKLIGIERTDNAVPLCEFKHPERCCYVLGPEDGNLSNKIIEKSQHILCLPGDYCLNVSVAGSIVMYDRIVRTNNATMD